MGFKIRLLVALLCGAVATACSFSEEFADQAIDYNQTIETAVNRQMLLNALRARDRMPLYFATISKLTGAVSLSIDAGVSTDISVPDVGTATVVTPSASVTHENSPFFDLAPQLSREFMAGMLQPIDMALMDFLWQQGWSEEVLLYLTIEKVRFDPPIHFCGDSEPISVIRNDPSSDVDMDRFRRLILLFRNFYGIDTERKTVYHAIGPVMSSDSTSGHVGTLTQVGPSLVTIGAAEALPGESGLELSTLGNYAKVDSRVRELLKTGKGSGGLTGIELPAGFKGDPNSLYLLTQKREEYQFHFSQNEVGCNGEDESVKIKIGGGGDSGAIVESPVSGQGESVEQSGRGVEEQGHPRYSVPAAREQGEAGLAAENEKEHKRIAFHIFLRGTQDIVTYLGELLRRVHYGGKAPIMIDPDPPDLDPANNEVLFALTEMPAWGNNDYGLSVDYRGKLYGVPHEPEASPNPAGRTTEVLALLNQLLALNQKSETLPSTTATVISK